MDMPKLIEKIAKKKMRKILLIEGEDERIIKAASLAIKDKIARPVLLGKKEFIEKIAKKNKIDLKNIEIVDFKNYREISKLENNLFDLRKHKGLTIEQAKDLLKNPNYFGAMLLKEGIVDGAVGGCKFSTAEWMRPVFQLIGTKEKGSIVSAVCIMPIKERVFFFSDTDFNIIPNENELAQIAINASDFAKSFVKPKVALLSYSTKGSGEHPSLEPIKKALDIIRKSRPDIIIDGELQLDAAVNPVAAKRKCPDSVIKGDANVLIFPNISVGNILLHAFGQFTEYRFFGSFPVGLAKPVMNGGRSFNEKQIYDLILGCAMVCNL